MRAFKKLIPMICGLALWAPTLSMAKGLVRTQVRRQHRGIIKRVTVKFAKQKLHLQWQTPSGKQIVYHVTNVSPGLKKKLQRYAKAGHTVLGVGGRFAMIGKGKGRAKIEFAYRIKQMWRGVLAVKIDGFMPLYTATILPNKAGEPALSYKIQGIVRSTLDRKDNRLVCLYGGWFRFVDGPHMVSQISGIRGRSLYFFPAKYKRPRSWRNLGTAKARWKAFQAHKRRRATGRPQIHRKALIPILPSAKARRYQERCQQRLSPIDKKRASKQPFVRILTHKRGASTPTTSRPKG